MKSRVRAVLLLLTAGSVPVHTQQSGHGTLLLRVEPECSVTRPVTNFAGRDKDGALSGTTMFRYKLRTSRGGGASIELRLDRPGTLDYIVRLAGRESSGSQVVPDNSSVTVARFGSDAHSPREGEAGSISWTLHNALATTPRFDLTIRCN